MADSALLEDPALRAQQANRSSIPETATGVAAQGAQMLGGEGKDMYYTVGSTVTNRTVDNTKFFSDIKNSKSVQNLRTNHADKISKFNEGSKSVDNFFVRMKDKAVKGAKDTYYWTREKITGKKAPVTAATESTETLAGTGGKLGAAVAEDGTAITNAAKGGIEGATKEVGMFGKAFGVLGKAASIAAIPLTLAVGAFQTNKSVKKYDGHGAAKNVGNTLGSLGGGFAAGAMEGLVLGGILGLEVPIVGSIVLGIGGAIVGGWLGSKAANKIGGDKWQASLDKKKAHDEMMHQAALGRSASPAQEQAYYPQNGEGLGANHYADRIRAEQAMGAAQSPVHG